MPEEVMKKYKQGELPADYSKERKIHLTLLFLKWQMKEITRRKNGNTN